MSSNKVYAYNKRSMRRLGWTPEDFNCSEGDDDSYLAMKISRFQSNEGLTTDGMCGPDTFRRLQTVKEMRFINEHPDARGFIRCAGRLIPTDFKAVPCSYGSAYSLMDYTSHSYRRSTPISCVWHWDAALSTESCYRILKRRRTSAHGGIDNDGVFYQFLDFCDHAAWHAGDRGVNASSVGFEVSNAVYLKYASYYRDRWGPRPIWNATAHGHTQRILGFYESQIKTCIHLSRFLKKHLDIPLTYPKSTTVIRDPENFEGHMCHYHVTRRKWDVAGFPFERIMREADF